MEPMVSRESARSRLSALIRQLAGSPRSPVDSPENLQAAADRVGAELQSAGCRVEFDPVPFRGGHFHNVYGTLGGIEEEPVLILAAHHDSAPGSPDADALSGLAVLLETARACAGAALQIPVVFASYTLENWGRAGSGRHVSRLADSATEVLGMINLGSVGYASDARGSQHFPALLKPFYPRRGNFLGVVGNLASRPFLRSVAKGLREMARLPVSVCNLPGRGFLVPEMRTGDHASFWDAGYPAVMVTDTAVFRNPHHQRPSDRPETLNFAFLEGVAASIAKVVHNLSVGNNLERLATANATGGNGIRA